MHDDFSASDIYRILRERRLSILLWTLLFGAAALLWATVSPPSYTAAATLLVGTDLDPLPTELSGIGASYEPLVLDHVAALTSTSLAAEVAENLNLKADPEFRPKANQNASAAAAQSALIRNFRKNLSVSNTEESKVLEVRFVSQSAEKSAKIANAITQTYLATQTRFDKDRSAELTKWVNSRTFELQNTIIDIESKLVAMRQLKNLPLVSSELQAQEQQRLNEQMLALQSEKAEVQAKLALAKRLGRSSDGANLQLENTVSSATLRSLMQQKAEIQHSIAELSTNYGPKHPLMVSATAKRSQIASQIRREASNIRRALQNRLDVVNGREAELTSQVESSDNRSSSTYIENIQLERFERELDAKKRRLETLLGVKDSLAQREGLNTRSQTTRVVAPALVPHEPSSPSRSGLIGLAILTGLLFGSFWALLGELLDTRVTSARKLQAFTTHLPLGQIPLVKAVGGHRSSSAKYLVDHPEHEFAAALRNTQWHLSLQQGKSLKGTLLVTSAFPEEGKTTVATALARLLSMSNNTVLLIDANFGHPDCHRELGVKQKSRGLSSLFVKKQRFYRLLSKDPLTNVHLLSTGPVIPDPAFLFAQKSLALFLKFAESKYDIIVIDGPALSTGPEALLLSRQAQATLLVMDAHSTKRDDATEAIRSAESASDGRVGIVLNKVRHASQQLLFPQPAPTQKPKTETRDSVISVTFPREESRPGGETPHTEQLEPAVTAQAGSLGARSRQILEALIKIAEKEERTVNISESSSGQRQ